jgi:hypothetical protein
MESNCYKKHRGGARSAPTKTPAAAAPPTVLCEHVSPRGYRCNMLPLAGSDLCSYHARRAESASAKALVAETIATDLLASIDNCTSAEAVNLFLGNLVKQVVRKRIARRDAVTLAYLCQLLLNSLSAMNRNAQHAPAPPPPRVIWDMPRPDHEKVPYVADRQEHPKESKNVLPENAST